MDQLWESLCEFGGWVCCSQSFGLLHIYSGFSLHSSSLSAFGNPVCFCVPTGRWLGQAPRLLDFFARSSRLILALSMDLFHYWGQMMWERFGVENQSPFTTEMGRFLGAGVRRARRVSVAEGKFLV